MWTNDVGRAEAGNYNLLKLIFEVNLKLYSKQSKKKVLFVLRDFSSELDNGQSIENTLKNNINQIWREIKKPMNLNDKIPSDFFDFEFLLMPHKIFEPQKFNEEVTKLRRLFDRSASNSLFLWDSHQKDIPIDGLPAFISHAWNTI